MERLENQMQLLKIENTELHEKYLLSDKATSDTQERLNASTQERKTLEERVASVGRVGSRESPSRRCLDYCVHKRKFNLLFFLQAVLLCHIRHKISFIFSLAS